MIFDVTMKGRPCGLPPTFFYHTFLRSTKYYHEHRKCLRRSPYGHPRTLSNCNLICDFEKGSVGARRATFDGHFSLTPTKNYQQKISLTPTKYYQQNIFINSQQNNIIVNFSLTPTK